MMDDCFGAKPEAHEHGHELPLSAESRHWSTNDNRGSTVLVQRDGEFRADG